MRAYRILFDIDAVSWYSTDYLTIIKHELIVNNGWLTFDGNELG